MAEKNKQRLEFQNFDYRRMKKTQLIDLCRVYAHALIYKGKEKSLEVALKQSLGNDGEVKRLNGKVRSLEAAIAHSVEHKKYLMDLIKSYRFYIAILTSIMVVSFSILIAQNVFMQ